MQVFNLCFYELYKEGLLFPKEKVIPNRILMVTERIILVYLSSKASNKGKKRLEKVHFKSTDIIRYIYFSTVQKKTQHIYLFNNTLEAVGNKTLLEYPSSSAFYTKV